MIRTVLITEVKNTSTGETKNLYGRFDIVALNNRGYEIIKSYKQRFTMTDEMFAKAGTPIE